MGNRSIYTRKFYQSKHLLIMLIPVIIWYFIFCYLPMYGLVISFEDYHPLKGILGSPWIGLKNFIEFFESYYFLRVVKNTLLLNIYGLLWGFPFPIIFALVINEIKDGTYKKSIQTFSYLPHFISTVIVMGMIVNFLSPVDGVINNIINGLGGETINFLMSPKYYRTIYISSGIWQGFGWNSIIYLATLSGIDKEQYEAAIIDGSSRLQRMRYISIPGMMPTIVILLLLNLGSMMSIGPEKALLLYSPATYETGDIITTYVYRKGILDNNFSFGSAVDFFNSCINFLLLITFNKISKLLNETSLW